MNRKLSFNSVNSEIADACDADIKRVLLTPDGVGCRVKKQALDVLLSRVRTQALREGETNVQDQVHLWGNLRIPV
jgi:hypothetical protein